VSEVEQINSRLRASLDLRRYDQAVSEAQRLLAVAGPSAAGFALLAQAQMGLGRFEEAERSAVAGLAQDPYSEHLLRIRAVARGRQGRTAEALESIDEALRLAPDQPRSHNYRAVCLEAMERYDEALDAARRAVSLDPHDASYLLQLGALELRTDPAAAEARFRDGLRIDPGSAELLVHLGIALLKQKRIDDARTAFRSALLIDPSSKPAKEGVRVTVENKLLKVGGLGAAGIVAMRALMVSGRFSGVDSRAGYAFLGAAAVVALSGLVVLPRWARARNQKKLAESDPQLLAIYQRLQADKQAGRL